MKRFKFLFTVILLAVVLCITISADGNVTYKGRYAGLIFEPGSSYSPTDLFTEFKDVMPGDSLTQQITVRNGGNTRVKIYMRALGAHEGSEEFLSKLNLTVTRKDRVLFDDTADKRSNLNKWVLVGTFMPFTSVDLDVTLNVPTDLDNNYQELVGYLDWEFLVEELYDPYTPDYPDEGIDIKVTKVWKDSYGDIVAPPEDAYVTVELFEGDNLRGTVTLSDDNGWEYVFKNRPDKDAGGRDAVYSVKEYYNGEGWETEITGDALNGFVITNTKIDVDSIDVKVTKVWQDLLGNVVKAPDGVFVTVALFADGGSGRTVILNEENNWTHNFKKLPQFDKNGKTINYTIAETTDSSLWNAMISGNPIDGFVIVNTLAKTTEESMNINVKKLWKDADGNEISAPADAEITVVLKADGIPVSNIVLTEKQGWEHTYEYMPLKGKNGNSVDYDVEEIYDNNGWVSSVSGDAENGFVIVNKLKETEYKSISVEKVWKDANGKNVDAPKGKVVSIELTANGIPVDSVELSIANGWTHVFENIPITDEYGKTIEYSVTEYFEDTNWVSAVSGDIENGFIVTNTEKETPDTPQTGDDSMMGLWQIMAVGSFAMVVILVVLLIVGRKKKEN